MRSNEGRAEVCTTAVTGLEQSPVVDASSLLEKRKNGKARKSADQRR